MNPVQVPNFMSISTTGFELHFFNKKKKKKNNMDIMGKVDTVIAFRNSITFKLLNMNALQVPKLIYRRKVRSLSLVLHIYQAKIIETAEHYVFQCTLAMESL